MRGRSSASRCAASATAAAPRTRCRRPSRRSGARRPRTSPDRGPGAPWLYAVARNAIVDRARSAHRRPGRDPRRARARAGAAPTVAEQGWVAWRVHRALEELPEREREVIALAYWSGLSQSEVAEFLGLPLGTVKTRTRCRALAPRRAARRGARVNDFDDIVDTDGLAPEEEAARCAACTNCSCRPGRPPICRPRSSAGRRHRRARSSHFPLLPPAALCRRSGRRGRARRARLRRRLPASATRHAQACGVRDRSASCRCTGTRARVARAADRA